jgi:hypothetical protein
LIRIKQLAFAMRFHLRVWRLAIWQVQSVSEVSHSTEDNIAIAAVRREFTEALAEVLAESAGVCPVRRGRVARAHAAIKRHPSYNEHEFCAAVEFAFEQWETLQNAGSPASAIARSKVASIITG